MLDFGFSDQGLKPLPGVGARRDGTPIASGSSRRWALRTSEGLRIFREGGEALVFNPLSWQTHYLNETALRVLDALTSGPRPLEDLVAAALEGSAPADAHWRSQVLLLLEELERMGLVVRADE